MSVLTFPQHRVVLCISTCFYVQSIVVHRRQITVRELDVQLRD